ncbi:asparaginase [Olsenella sp. DNF00959]|uniref:asparaginase n=1 Tax=Olsenella sp. DNF00959 TaxID=1476999 RepID=UPI0007836ADF|nr:asparaginase [Olsenella sp. DNF00959]
MKRILIVATGGTIASLPQGGGLSPALSGEELAAFVPQLDDLCELSIVQPMNIDSTNMRPMDWLRIASMIEGAYDDFDGFVVLHGTDTMAYTSAALSYLVRGSRKPIVLTGSQQPMSNPFTDAKLNLYQSVLYACDDGSRDVSVAFNGSVIAGTRAHKQRTLSFNAFTSVNYPPLAVIRSERIIRQGGGASDCAAVGGDRRAAGDCLAVGRGERAAATDGNATAADVPARRPDFYHELDERVIVLKLTPELRPSIFDLLRRDYDAVVLETFGIGGIPEYDGNAYQRAIYGWVASGRTLVITTQVPEEGLDLGVYEVGRAYADHPGILRADDMTTEALVAKTMWALGQTRDQDEVARLFYAPVNHDRTLG